MVEDVRLFQYRLRLFARAREVGATQACRSLANTLPGTTDRSRWWSAMAWRSCGRGNAGCPGCQSGTTLAGGAIDRLRPRSAWTRPAPDRSSAGAAHVGRSAELRQAAQLVGIPHPRLGSVAPMSPERGRTLGSGCILPPGGWIRTLRRPRLH
jgi:hypothetical protein